MVSVFFNILDLAGINVRILFKEHQQQENPEESPAAADRRAEGRTVGTRWAAADPTTAAAAETDNEAVPVRKSCKENKTLET